MQIIRHEQNIIPQTVAGRAFADEYEARLKEQLAFEGREEGTLAITLKAVYYFDIVEDENK